MNHDKVNVCPKCRQWQRLDWPLDVWVTPDVIPPMVEIVAKVCPKCDCGCDCGMEGESAEKSRIFCICEKGE